MSKADEIMDRNDSYIFKLADMYDLANTLESEVKRLRDFIIFEATCPCCSGITECDDDCTLADEEPRDFTRMAYARYFLEVTLRI